VADPLNRRRRRRPAAPRPTIEFVGSTLRIIKRPPDKHQRTVTREEAQALQQLLVAATAPDADYATIQRGIKEWKQRNAHPRNADAPRAPVMTGRARVERRPRERREQRHTARATSSADPPAEPAPALAPAPPPKSNDSRCPDCGSVLLLSGGREICAMRSCVRWGRPA